MHTPVFDPTAGWSPRFSPAGAVAGGPLPAEADAVVGVREGEECFRSAFHYAAIGMALVALNGRWMQVNNSLCRMVGYTRDELIRKDFQSITHPHDLETDLEFLQRLVAGEIEHYEMTKRYFHKDGHLVWVRLSVSLVRDPDRFPLYFVAQMQDISERQRIEDALRASEEEHRAMFELAGVGKMQIDLATGRFLRVNRKFCDMLGYSQEELLGQSFEQVTAAEDRDAGRRLADAMLRSEVAEQTTEKRYRRKDGRHIWVSLNAAVVRDPAGRPARAVATVVDVTARKYAEWLEQDRREVLEMLVHGCPIDAILERLAAAIDRQLDNARAAFMLVRDGNVSLVRSALPAAWARHLAAECLQITAALCGRAWGAPENCGTTFLDSDPLWKASALPGLGSEFKTCWAAPLQTEDGPLGTLAVFSPEGRTPSPEQTRMINTAAKLATVCIEHHNATHRLTHLVHHDSLTGLANRVLFEDRLEQALTLSARNDRVTALLLLDVDHFKQINDTAGHQVGDHLLQEFATRLRAATRAGDTVARIGGDEFAIVLPDLKNTADAEEIARRAVQGLNAPFNLPGRQHVKVTASIGVAIAVKGESPSALRGRADKSLYRVKAGGRNGYRLD